MRYSLLQQKHILFVCRKVFVGMNLSPGSIYASAHQSSSYRYSFSLSVEYGYVLVGTPSLQNKTAARFLGFPYRDIDENHLCEALHR